MKEKISKFTVILPSEVSITVDGIKSDAFFASDGSGAWNQYLQISSDLLKNGLQNATVNLEQYSDE